MDITTANRLYELRKQHGYSQDELADKLNVSRQAITVNFKNTGTVTATGFVGGSIGVLAGPVKYAQFVNSSGNLSIAAVNAVGGSVGFIGVPTPLETILTGVGITLADDYVKVENTHFEASGELTANPDSNAISVAKDAATNKSTGWGGVPKVLTRRERRMPDGSICWILR